MPIDKSDPIIEDFNAIKMHFCKSSILLAAALVLLAPTARSATVISTNPVNLFGPGYDYLNIRFNSPTGENAVLADRVASGLEVLFTGFVSQSSGTNSVMDFATGNLGLTIKSQSPNTIPQLDITANGTFDLKAPHNSSGYAGFHVSVPFNLTLTGINGNPFLGTPPTVGLSLGISYSPPGSATYVDSPAPEFSSGNWMGNWNGNIAALFPAVFTSPTMQVTELSLAITPNVTVWSQNGTASAYLTSMILQPIPEPSTLSLLALGGTWVLFRRRKN